MSNQYFKTSYHCLSDCRFEGCPGHELVLHIAHTSSTISIDRDGENLITLDDNAWDAVLRLANQNPNDSFHPLQPKKTP